MMLKRTIAVVLTLALMLTGCGALAGETLNLSGFESAGMDGESVDGSVFQGHTLTMINVWGTFCGPCLREMPDLEKLSRSYGDDFQLIGIPVDTVDYYGRVLPDTVEEAQALLTALGVTYRQIMPSDSLIALFLNDVQYVPTTLFTDEAGNVLGVLVGSRSFEEWKEITDALLEVLK